MKCACGGDTFVSATRQQPKGRVWRKRKCPACGAAFATIELRRADLKPRAPYALTPEQRARKNLRREARREAAATGVPIQELYERWGCT